MKNIVLNIPHSSINGIFDAKFGKWSKSPFFINDVVKTWTDWYADYLFSTDNDGIKKVVFPYSRFVCDVEKTKDDEIIYTSFDNYRRAISEEERENVLDLWRKHQKELIRSINKDTILIDCHSFSSELRNCDICIGFNNDWSYDEEAVGIIEAAFKNKGYSIKLNELFDYSITPKTDFEYKSVMIEVNKRVYMCEKTLTLNPNIRQWMRWHGAIKEIYGKLTCLN